MRRLNALRADFDVLRSLLRGMPRDVPLQQRLQSFYAPQAGQYDAFRERLLQGRRELISSLSLPPNARVVELGGGTGRNLDFFTPQQWSRIARFELVDLCPALIERARERRANDDRIRIHEADATAWKPSGPVDCVYLSYALSMIPDWRGAIANALDMLKPGGTLAVVDFYVSPAKPQLGRARHGAFTRWFWPRWFGHDGVMPSAEHLPLLGELMPQHALVESRARVPYLPLLRVPYYRFVGRKPLRD